MRQRNSDGFSLSLSNKIDKSFGVYKIRPFREEEEDNQDKKEFLRIGETNIPRLLLRQKYPKHQYPFLFCKIEETIEAFKNRTIFHIDNNIIDSILSSCESKEIYGFPKEFLLNISKSSTSESFFLLNSILYRLHLCYTIIDECRYNLSEENQKTIFWIQLFIDSHLDLCNYMIDKKSFSDEQLFNYEYNKDDLSKSSFQQYHPHDSRIAYCGDLPDLISCIDMGNIWYSVKPKSRMKNITSALIHIIGCKTQSHKCQLRNFIKILRGYFKDFPVMIDLFRFILELSMMGNYPHAIHRPRFEQRLQIRKSFQNREDLTNEILFDWMSQNCQIVYYATKEMYMFTVERHKILDLIMSETTHWDRIKENIKKSTEMIRKNISKDNYPETNTLHDLQPELELMHQNTLNYITKLKKCNFVKKMIHGMDVYYKKHQLEEKSISIQSSEIILFQYFQDDEEKYLSFLQNMKFVVDEMKDFELKWLICFSISEDSYENLRRLYFDYEYKDIPDNSLSKRIKDIYQTKPFDFHLIRIYLNMLIEKDDFTEYNLSSDYAENQIQALKAKLFIPPWKSLPKEADLFYYCSICRKWANPIVDPLIAKTRMNYYSQGSEQVLYNHDDNSLYCGKYNTSINIRKIINSNENFDDDVLDDLDIARKIRRHKECTRCYYTELKTIHMIGKIKKLNGKLWALCEICASLTQWEGAKFSKLGFTCTKHFTLKNNNPSINNNSTDKCLYCEIPLINENRTLQILNDDNNQFKLMYAKICNTHFEMCKYLFRNSTILRKSKLCSVITNRTNYEGSKTHFIKPRKILI